MQTVTIQTMREPAQVIRTIHDQRALSAWRTIGGVDLQSWLLGNRLVIGAEDGPNTAIVEASPSGLMLEHATDAEGWFVRRWSLLGSFFNKLAVKRFMLFLQIVNLVG